MESRLFSAEMEPIRRCLGFEYGFFVDCEDRRGGLAMFWKKEVSFSLINHSKFHIQGYVDGSGSSFPWVLMGFYGDPVRRKRKHSWKLLRRISMKDSPWVMIGDFNAIASSGEKEGGSQLSADKGFQTSYASLGVVRLRVRGTAIHVVK